MYRGTTDFHVLFLYPTVFLHSVFDCLKFFGGVLDVFCFFFLPDCYGQTSNTILDKCGERGHICLVPDLKSFQPSPLSVILSV